MPEPVLHREESNDVAYEFTETAFRKTSKLPFPGVRPDGTPYIWKRSWYGHFSAPSPDATEIRRA